MIKLLATCDRILARLPPAMGEGKIIGGIIIPDNVKLSDKKPIVELLIESAGPDCKVAKAGMKVIVNKNVCAPIEYNGVEWMVFSEVTAMAIVKEETNDIIAPVVVNHPPVLDIAAIRDGLGMAKAPKDDASALPVEAAVPGA